MSERWHYRIGGHEFGPVSFELLQTLVALGTIAPDDEVRNGASTTWILACAATELHPSLASSKSATEVERRTYRNEWYCRRADGEIGPLELSDLITLAANGGLNASEEVKAWADDYWKEIGSIGRLVELLPFPDQNRKRPAEIRFPIPKALQPSDGRGLSSSDVGQNLEEQILLFPGVESRSDLSIQATDGLDEVDCPDTALSVRWSGWIAGTEHGPVDFEQLTEWVTAGRLSPLDFVRQGESGQYIPAINVPGLFCVRPAKNPYCLHCDQTENPDENPLELTTGNANPGDYIP